MTDAISNHNRIKSDPLSVDKRSKTDEKSSVTSKQAAPSAIVELSSDEVRQSLAETPEINQNRIDQIKSALASGNYQPDPEVIAQKFAEIEKLLP